MSYKIGTVLTSQHGGLFKVTAKHKSGFSVCIIKMPEQINLTESKHTYGLGECMYCYDSGQHQFSDLILTEAKGKFREAGVVLTSRFSGQFRIVRVSSNYDEYYAEIIVKPRADEWNLKGYEVGDNLLIDMKTDKHKLSDLVLVDIFKADPFLELSGEYHADVNLMNETLSETQEKLALADETVEVLEGLVENLAKALAKEREITRNLRAVLNINMKPVEPFNPCAPRKPIAPYPPYTVGDAPFPRLGEPFIALLNGQPRVGIVTSFSGQGTDFINKCVVEFPAEVGDKSPRDY